ncbi:T9SS type A sorting domain-containing protein [Chitinophaga pendula]|uniref:glycosyl hydrolase family 18 protein n=1 Tax=Chitinophaga TaxID=79328 RepID=UPI000BAF803C|nr:MULTISPECIES: glycosyl hydrolase family 18 protein [Chitinophaga]ASZ13413.1 glycoside hydrolase [Chitinophaga sp. MD30]UCJ08963.1 T9SS type A sorting domain-containing protein [Chitinophaga pendula]
MKINSILSLRNVNRNARTALKFLCALLLTLSFTLSASTVSAQFKVIGYMPSWAGDVNTVQYSKLTHINYAFLLPTNTGGLQAIENPSKLQSLVSTAHARGVKVLISVGGWNNGNDQGFESLAANATYRNNFVNNMINFVNQYNLDGTDIDWEYPDAGASANNYVALMTQLSNAMHSRGKLLTAAVVGSGGASILGSVFPLVDYLMLMAYDYNNFDHSTYAHAQQSLSYWRGRGLPKEKAILGVPFYGRPSWESYAQLLARGASPNSDIFNGVFYNGLPTIRSKTNLAFDQGGGIMMWELSQDATGANSLLSAIYEVKIQRGGAGPNTPAAPVGKTIWLQGFNNNYVSSKAGQGAMWCNETAIQGNNRFLVVDAGGGKVALSSNGLYVSSENGTQPITCNRPTIQDWEKFDWITTADGKVALRGSNGLYISSENGVQAMTCTRPEVQGWEAFTFGEISAARSAQVGEPTPGKEIDGNKERAAVVFPNPVTKGSPITIKVQDYDSKAPVEVSVLDLNKKVLSNVKANTQTVSVGTANIPGGYYIIVITNGRNSYTKRVLVL